MYKKYSAAFLIASVIQALVILSGELMELSHLGIKMDLGQMIIHLLTGQALGFLLMVIIEAINNLNYFNIWFIGSFYGSLTWFILISINSNHGVINKPWRTDISTVLITLVAFIVYGIIIAYSIKRLNDNKSLL